MSTRVTPNRGLRYPDFLELNQAEAFARFVGDLETAANKTDALRASALRRPRARVFRLTGSQSVVKVTWTALTGFDTVSYDNAGMANLGVNNDRLTAQANGLYLATAMCDMPSPGTDPDGAYLAISKNGATNGSVDFVKRSNKTFGSSQYTLTNTCCFLLNSGDRLSLAVYWSGTPAGPFTFQNYTLAMTMIATNP